MQGSERLQADNNGFHFRCNPHGIFVVFTAVHHAMADQVDLGRRLDRAAFSAPQRAQQIFDRLRPRGHLDLFLARDSVRIPDRR